MDREGRDKEETGRAVHGHYEWERETDDVLASRLESQFGVVGAASSWLRSYLRGRQQFMRLGRHSSPMTQCDCGVLQGSVLGPLLFTAYVSSKNIPV